MKKKIFLYVIMLIIFSFIASNISAILTAKKHYNEEIKYFLNSMLELATSYPIMQNEDMNEFAKNKARVIGGHVRITIISLDGTVLGDSEASYLNMENHINRSEVINAIEKGYGESIRYSETLNNDMLYLAKKVNNNLIIRMSFPLYKGHEFALDLIPSALFVTILAFILSLFFVNRLTNKLIIPFYTLQKALSTVILGELDTPLPKVEYEELEPLTENLRSLISQLKLYISSIQQQSGKIDYIINNMHEGLVMVDEHTNILLINDAAKRFLNINIDVVEKNIMLYIRNDEIVSSIQNTLSQKKLTVIDVDSKIFENKVLRFYLSPVFGDNSNINNTGVIILISDVTEIKNAEKVRTNFVANVSHELKTPITTIKGFTELLSAGMISDPAVSSRYLQLMLVECERLINLINDILKLSELEDISIYTSKEAVNVFKVCCDVKELLCEQATEKSITIKVSGACGEILAGYDRIKELIINLVDNAIKYNNIGGRVNITVNDDNKFVKLIVEDTGIGIPKKYQARVFERFYRVDKGRSKVSGGTGLGLSIVKHIVSLYGGTINLSSSVGIGTKIEIMLPKQATT